MLDLETLWQFVCDSFQKTFSPLTFSTWIDTAKPIQFENKTLVVEVPSVLHRDYWKNNVVPTIIELLEPSLGYKLNVLIKTPEESNPLEQQDSTASFGNNPVIKNEQELPSFLHETHLNSKYTFDTFVVGKGNQMAHAASLAVAEDPGVVYNPLFLYGGVGLGKTHLMHAIGHQMLSENPNAKVKYVSSEQFANDFISSIQTKKQEEFRQEYRSVDLLLIDDIQFFADKLATQEEFFHTFNALFDDKKQIVLSSDRLPNEIPKLQQRLVTRFKWGLSVDITPPDFETRIAILRNKAEADNLAIPNEALSYIAGQIDSNIRELEGALTRVQAFARVSNTSDITTSTVAEALNGYISTNPDNEITIPLIQGKVAKYFNVTVSELKGRKRVKTIVVPRQIAMYLAREMTTLSLPAIGREFGGKDHTTVIHAHEKIQAALLNNKQLQKDITSLKEEIRI